MLRLCFGSAVGSRPITFGFLSPWHVMAEGCLAFLGRGILVGARDIAGQCGLIEGSLVFAQRKFLIVWDCRVEGMLHLFLVTRFQLLQLSVK